jgi:CRP-like cAMP-binding protein
VADKGHNLTLEIFERACAGLDAPFALVDLDAMWQNAASMLARADGLSKITGLCSIQSYSTGETILEAGQKAEQFFIVMEGEIDILARDDSTLVGHVRAGDFLGEISLVSQRPYGARAIAASSVQLAALKNQDFENLINRYPRIGMNVMRNIAISLGQKLAELDERFYRGVISER